MVAQLAAVAAGGAVGAALAGAAVDAVAAEAACLLVWWTPGYGSKLRPA